MMHWLKLNEIPNSFSLLVEVAIGAGIALYLFYLQLKTSRSNDALIKKIDSYTESKKKLEDTTRKFYVNKIIDDLMYIKQQDQRAMEVVDRFQEADHLPDGNTVARHNEQIKITHCDKRK